MLLKGEIQTGRVWLDGNELLPARSQKVSNHSPDGFMWGYGGSGPAQLALAILLEKLDDEDRAIQLYQDFKWEVISGLPECDIEVEIDFATWMQSKDHVMDWLQFSETDMQKLASELNIERYENLSKEELINEISKFNGLEIFRAMVRMG